MIIIFIIIVIIIFLLLIILCYYSYKKYYHKKVKKNNNVKEEKIVHQEFNEEKMNKIFEKLISIQEEKTIFLEKKIESLKSNFKENLDQINRNYYLLRAYFNYLNRPNFNVKQITNYEKQNISDFIESEDIISAEDKIIMMDETARLIKIRLSGKKYYIPLYKVASLT